VLELQAVIAFARKRIPHARIGLIGYSMGAVVSLLGAAGEPGVEALVLDSPFSDLRTLLAENVRRAARLPGAPFVWVGSTLLVLGLLMVFFFPHRRVWVRIRKTSGGSEVLCASTMKRDLAFKPQFHQLIADIQLAAVPSETTDKAGRNDA